MKNTPQRSKAFSRHRLLSLRSNGRFELPALLLATVFGTGLLIRCEKSRIQNPFAEEQIKVLFIGNSLTYSGGFYDYFAGLCEAGSKDVYYFDWALSGVTLRQHAARSLTRRRIEQELWDFVVLQDADYAIAFPEADDGIYRAVDQLLYWIRSNSIFTAPIFFMDYSLENGIQAGGIPYSYSEFQTMLRTATIGIADSLVMSVAPVGWAWKAMRESMPELDLYYVDRGHPSRYGAYLMACVYYVTFFRERVEGVPFYGDFAPDSAMAVQRIASDVVLDEQETWNLIHKKNP